MHSMLGSSWHLQGIVTPVLITLATKVDIRRGGVILGGVDVAPGAPGEGDLGGGIQYINGLDVMYLARQWAKGPANFVNEG